MTATMLPTTAPTSDRVFWRDGMARHHWARFFALCKSEDAALRLEARRHRKLAVSLRKEQTRTSISVQWSLPAKSTTRPDGEKISVSAEITDGGSRE